MDSTHHQPCWYCTKACGKCSWSKNGTPVDNWVATPTITDNYYYDGNHIMVHSFKIISCPEFVDERIEYIKAHPHLRPYQLINELHISLASAKRLYAQAKEILSNEKSI